MEYNIAGFGGGKIDAPVKDFVKYSDEPARVDEVSASLIYVGYTRTSAPVETTASWKIKRITKVGSIWTIAYANGNELYENIWSNRASLTYI